LVLAVFLDGLSRILGANPEREPEHIREAQGREAQAWMAAGGVGVGGEGEREEPDDDSHPFTFRACCDVLALDPGAVRHAMATGATTLAALMAASDGLLSPHRGTVTKKERNDD